MVKSKIENELSEEHDKCKQKTNIIIHGVGESQSTNAKDRQQFDLNYVLEMSNAALGVKLADSEVNEIIRLVKPPNDGKSRPLLVSFAKYNKNKVRNWKQMIHQGNLVVWVVGPKTPKKIQKSSGC